MKRKPKSPCRFVYQRESVETPSGTQSHMTATIALVPRLDRVTGKLIGIGIGASYRSPDDNPSYASGRKYALQRARAAIKHKSIHGFSTAPVPEHVLYPVIDEAFGGRYVTAVQWKGPLYELILNSMQAGFDTPEIDAVGCAIFKMIEHLS